MVKTVLDVLPSSEDRAISLEEIAERTGMMVGAVVRSIRDYRANGAGICESHNKFWLSCDPDEITQTADFLFMVAERTMKAAKGMRRTAERKREESAKKACK